MIKIYQGNLERKYIFVFDYIYKQYSSSDLFKILKKHGFDKAF